MIDFEGYFWLLKSLFPGDPEFTAATYSELPYPYVLSAVEQGVEQYKKKLHDQERPTALFSALYLNSKKDPKKKSKPLTYLDFSFYKPISGGEAPLSHNGAAYLELIKRKLLPSWALFCFKAVSSGASNDYIPERVALIADDAILLHPRRTGKAFEGMLIAQESASNQFRTFVSTEGDTIRLRVPCIDTKVVAREGEVLTP